MCQDLQALHLKCFLCQSNILMCSHFKANPIPGLKYVTLADITVHITIFSVYYHQELRCNRYRSHPHSSLICLHCLFVFYVHILVACQYIYTISADSSIPCNMLSKGVYLWFSAYTCKLPSSTLDVARCRDGDNGFKVS